MCLGRDKQTLIPNGLRIDSQRRRITVRGREDQSGQGAGYYPIKEKKEVVFYLCPIKANYRD